LSQKERVSLVPIKHLSNGKTRKFAIELKPQSGYGERCQLLVVASKSKLPVEKESDPVWSIDELIGVLDE